VSAAQKQAKALGILAQLVFAKIPKKKLSQPKEQPTDQPKGGSA
jgi:hypothetical protein